MKQRVALYLCLTVMALARLLLQSAAMPPYAGLDEIFHVACLSFVAEEGRAPQTAELSIPPYLHDSIQQRQGALPAFAQIAERWPDVVRTNPNLVAQGTAPVTPGPYRMANYEAQQPQLYYRLAAPLVKLLPARTAISELRLWRFLSVALGLVIVLATAFAAERLFGTPGILAAAVLVLLPTWHTLVVRVANDALASAAIAVAFAFTVAQPRRLGGQLAEAALWALALAVKLYTWPLAIVLPLVWWRQRARWPRIALVLVACGVSALLTLHDLSSRTSNPLGVVAFDRPNRAPLPANVDLGELVRVTIASGAWTSGQHWNALTPPGIALLFGPPLLLGGWLLLRYRRESGGWLAVPAAALLAFAAAQAFNVVSCVLARRAGNDIPIGGKEGWYWYVAAPIVVATVLPPLIARMGQIGRMGLFAWLIVVDVVIHEVALHHDYSGETSPLSPSLLFRWGPPRAPFTAALDGIAVGPYEDWLLVLRLVQVALLALLVRSLRPAGPSVAP
ncbi:MAG TPA: hypothetical protein VF618_06390 [Thermoanaerobaculia bacterium]